MSAVSRAQLQVQDILYWLDHARIMGALSSRKMAGLPVQIILDAGRMHAPSCSQQRACLLSVLDWGVEVRQWSPEEQLHANVHAKSFDRREGIDLGLNKRDTQWPRA